MSTDDVSLQASRDEHRALAIAAALAAVICIRISAPLFQGVFLGALVAFTMRPVHLALCRKTKKNALSAAICAAVAGLLLAGAIGAIAWLIVDRASVLGQQMPEALKKGGPVDRSTALITARLQHMGIQSPAIDDKLHHALDELGSYAAKVAGAAAAVTMSILVATFFMVMTSFTMLAGWARLSHWLIAIVPLRPLHTRHLLRELQGLGRSVLAGTVVTGVLQGSLAGLSYWVLGVPQPAFFGAMTAVASTIPVVGTMVVWVPLGAYLAGSGHVGAGVAELLWGGVVVVSITDGLVRPKLVERNQNMGLLPTLIGLFGGLELFGFMGLLLGPTAVGLALAILRLYGRERAVRLLRVHRARRKGLAAREAELRWQRKAPAR